MTIELELPKDINSIKLQDWMKFSKLAEANEDAENDFLDIKLLEIFAGLKYKDIQGLPVGTFDDALRYLSVVFQSKTPLTRRFFMTGSDGAVREFGFIPNLDKMTMGEYIDLNNYFESSQDIHKAMAVLFRPIHESYEDKGTYRIDSYKSAELYCDIMKEMPLGIALGAKVFFYRLGIKLSKAILNSTPELKEQVEDKLSEEEKSNLTKNIHGIKSFMLLQEEMLLKSQTPLKYLSTKQ